MATSSGSSRRAPTAASGCSPKCASWWRPAWRAGGLDPDGQDPARRGQRDEPGHAVPPPRAARLRGRDRGGRRAGCGDGAVRGAGAHPDGHEPARPRRMGGHPPDQGRARDARHSGDRAHRACDVRGPREGGRGGLRRLRHQAGRSRPAAREDRVLARAGGGRVSIDPAAQLRHELRTPLNHIIGYTEMLMEELESDDKLGLAAGLSALRTDARQLLTLLNEVLARGPAGPPDLAAARGTLGPALERVRAAGEALRIRVAEAGDSARLADLERVRSAIGRLDDLLGPHPGRAGSAVERNARPESPAAEAAPRAVILVVDDNEDNRDIDRK